MQLRSAARGIGFLILGLLTVKLGAEFVMPDLEKIPVDRLVGNLERMVAENPKDARLRVNLGRVHAMAYALKTDAAQVWRGREREGAWTGYEPIHTQFEVKPAADSARGKLAREHLAKAIARYREAVALTPDDPVAQLGLGWALLQAGETSQAIAALRRVIVAAWPGDRTAFRMYNWRSLTEEAGRYLIPLLDPAKDAAEIARLRERIAEIQQQPRAITPIAIPLRDGLKAVDLLDPQARVSFDADGSGVRHWWTWLTPKAGWLVFDHRPTKQIESGLQMFGNVSFWLFWENGYDAMRALDDNGDGRLMGTELDRLAVWHDRNGNGVSESGEVQSVAAWAIVSLSCAHQIDATHPDEIAYSPAGVTFEGGRTRPTFDLVLRRW